MEAAYRKYPNPYSSSVHSLDTLERSVTAAPGETVGTRLLSRRLFCTKWSIPSFITRVKCVYLRRGERGLLVLSQYYLMGKDLHVVWK